MLFKLDFMSTKWTVKPYNELSLDEFHDLIALRIDIFVVEQDCPYSELDGKDKIADHLIGLDENNRIIATARILPPGAAYEFVAIGRVVVHESTRGTGAGHQLLEESKNFIATKYGEVSIMLSAQKHLENYYEAHGFKSTGKEYLEDGIPHVEMKYTPLKKQS